MKRPLQSVLVLLAALGIASHLEAGPKEEVAAATARWAMSFVGENPDEILALYAPDAVLWGTLSRTVRQGPTALREYFVAAFEALPGHQVSFGEQIVRVYEDTAINTGYYTFTYVEDGVTKTLPARYTFVYRKTGNGWLIVDHHSSTMPGAALPGTDPRPAEDPIALLEILAVPTVGRRS